jgi:hypothetical protein
LRADLQALFRVGNFSYATIKQVFAANGYEQLAADFINKYNDMLGFASKMGIALKFPTESLAYFELAQEAGLRALYNTRDVIINNIVKAGLQGRVEQLPFNQIVAGLDDMTNEIGRRTMLEAREGLITFDRIVKSEQYEYAGIELFEYFGPLDEVTRDTCRATMNDPKQQTGWTREDIMASQVDFLGGGWNCRHEWIPFVGE